MRTFLRSNVLNERQCNDLVRNFSRGLQSIALIQSIIGGSYINVFDEAIKDLFQIVSKAGALIEECCKENWLEVVVMQINNKEAFRELLINLECCFDTICGIFQCHYVDQSEEINGIKRDTTFFPTSIDEVDQDLVSLDMKLTGIILQQQCSSEHVQLAKYLKGRIRGIQKAEGGALDIIVYPDDYLHPEYGRPLILVDGKEQGQV